MQISWNLPGAPSLPGAPIIVSLRPARWSAGPAVRQLLQSSLPGLPQVGPPDEEGRPGPGKDESWCCLLPSGRPEEPARKPVSGRHSPFVLRKTKRAVMPQPLVKFASVKVAPVQTPRAAESLWTGREAGTSVSPASV